MLKISDLPLPLEEQESIRAVREEMLLLGVGDFSTELSAAELLNAPDAPGFPLWYLLCCPSDRTFLYVKDGSDMIYIYGKAAILSDLRNEELKRLWEAGYYTVFGTMSGACVAIDSSSPTLELVCFPLEAVQYGGSMPLADCMTRLGCSFVNFLRNLRLVPGYMDQWEFNWPASEGLWK